MARLTIRIDFGNGAALGPGKVRLLELVDETGSIRKAAARMKMSYRQAWLLLKALAGTSGEALVDTATGGKSGGGARLTPLGHLVVKRYRSLEAAAEKAGAAHVEALRRILAAGEPRKRRTKRP
ncbi:MAG TPA: LysR family transcriptional regulator [Rhizomicrobium sp.]|jgi:molybdate transport system regulatory protein|nr:LysR family transcriptional regulator [Rhizomicrobium sp.]